jgi:hypothetical protein
MAEGERATGTPNTIYNLSSVLFHALQGGASYDTYIEDAEREGDEELTEFFRRVREEDRDRASEAQLLLAERTLTTAGTEDTALDAAATEGTAPGVAATADSEPDLPPGTEPSGREGTAPGVPATEDLTPGVAATEGSEPDVSPGTEEAPTRTEGGPLAEEVPSGTPPQAPPGDVQRGTSPTEQERNGQPEREREEDKGLIDRVKDALLGEEERGREGTGKGDRR